MSEQIPQDDAEMPTHPVPEGTLRSVELDLAGRVANNVPPDTYADPTLVTHRLSLLRRDFAHKGTLGGCHELTT